MSKENRVEVWLNRALEMEHRGRELYLDAVKKAKDSEAIDFFKMLAEQELVHLNIIRGLAEKIGGGRPEWQSDPKQQADLKALDEVFHKITLNKLAPGVGILEAIDKGLAFEREVRDYYKKEFSQAVDQGERDFLSRLAAEENSHYQMLSDMKLFYSDPESWNELQDNMHLDGV